MSNWADDGLFPVSSHFNSAATDAYAMYRHGGFYVQSDFSPKIDG